MTDALQDELDKGKCAAGKRLDDFSRILPFVSASIQLLIDDARTLFIARGFSEEQASRPMLRPVSTDTLVDGIVQSGKPLWIPDTASHPDWNEREETRNVRAWLGAPILDDTRPVGFLTLDFPEANPHFDNLLEDVAHLVEYLAPILSRSRLLDGHRRLRRDMAIVKDIVTVIGEKLEPAQLLEELVKQVAQHLSCSHCTVFFPKQLDGRQMLVATHAFGAGQTKTRHFAANEGVAGWVYKNGLTQVIADANADPRFASARAPRASGRSMLVAPIKVGDQTIGVISADQDVPGWFSSSDKDLLDALGQQTGIAIQRSMALTLLQDIARRILTLTVRREILQQVVIGAIELVNATTGVIYLLDSSKTVVVDEFSPPKFNHAPPRLDNPKGVTRTVLRTGMPVRIPDTRADTQAQTNPVVQMNPELPYKSMMAVPLKIDDDVIGVFFVDDVEEHRFTDMEESLLLTLASHSAVAIKQAELRDDLEARIRHHEELEKQLERLHGVVTTSGAAHVDRVLDLVGEGILAMFGPDVSPSINLLARDKEEFESPRTYGPLRDAIRVPPRPDGTGYHVVRTKAPIYVDDVRFPPPGVPAVRKTTMDLGVRSFAAVPLMQENHVLGVLFLNSEKSLAFVAHERRALEIFAAQAAKAIEHYRLSDAVLALRRTALEFFLRSGRADAKVVGLLELAAPDPVRVTAAEVATIHDVARLEQLLQPRQVGYFVYAGSLPVRTVEALDDLRKRRNPVVPLSVQVMTAAIADGKAAGVLAELERDYRSRENLFEARNALIDERFLFGRRQMLADVGNAVTCGEHILLFGLRKSGKTSFLNILRQHLAQHPVCSIDLQRYDARLEDWPPMLFHQVVAAFDAWGEATFKDWPGHPPAVVANASQLHDALAERRGWQRQRGRTERLIVVLDEIERVFQRSATDQEHRQFVRAAGALRSLAQQPHDPFVSIVATDLRSDLNQTNRVEDAGTNPFFEFFKEVPMPLLTEAALDEMVRSIGSMMGITTIASDFVPKLFVDTGGHPFLSRQVAAAAYRAKHGDVLNLQSLVAGLAESEERNVPGRFFEENLWGQLRTREKELLLRQLQESASGVPLAACPTERAALAALGLIDGSKIQIGLFEQWLRDVAATRAVAT